MIMMNLIVFLFVISGSFLAFNAKRIEVLMPNITTTVQDTYMVTYLKLGDDDRFITAIEPLTNADVA